MWGWGPYDVVTAGFQVVAVTVAVRTRSAAAAGHMGRFRWWSWVARGMVRAFGPRGDGLGILLAYGPLLDTEHTRRQIALPVLQRGQVLREAGGDPPPPLLGVYAVDAPALGAVGLQGVIGGGHGEMQGPWGMAPPHGGAAALYWELPPFFEGDLAVGRMDGRPDPNYPGDIFVGSTVTLFVAMVQTMRRTGWPTGIATILPCLPPADAWLIWNLTQCSSILFITNPLLLEEKKQGADARWGEIRGLRTAHGVILRELVDKQAALFLPGPTYVILLIGNNRTLWYDLIAKIMYTNLNNNEVTFKWNLHQNGQFSVRSMYLALTNNGFRDRNRGLWKLKLPLKIKIFLWGSRMCWALWLSTNDVMFDKVSLESYLQMFFKATYWLRF
uniref:Reverse transcriptase zinc-binding domain-containing protein n=1 Tax=Leersia perrieri TaxID=77586 RepID=A0A0D9X511_9ORYZ